MDATLTVSGVTRQTVWKGTSGATGGSGWSSRRAATCVSAPGRYASEERRETMAKGAMAISMAAAERARPEEKMKSVNKCQQPDLTSFFFFNLSCSSWCALPAVCSSAAALMFSSPSPSLPASASFSSPPHPPRRSPPFPPPRLSPARLAPPPSSRRWRPTAP